MSDVSPLRRRLGTAGSKCGPQRQRTQDQIVGTAFLVMFVVAIIDMRNTAVQANLGPFMIGLAVAAIGISLGANAGYAINPARDFGPRLFAWMAGCGQTALPGTVDGAFSWYFWVPIVGPIVGGVIGVLIYDWFIGDVLDAKARLAESTPPGRAGGETPPATEAATSIPETRTTPKRRAA